MVLGALGAEVTKAEPPTGDPSRRRGPFVGDRPHLEGSALFLYANRNKRGITFDRSTPTGNEILTALADRAEIVLWGAEPPAGQALQKTLSARPRAFLIAAPYGA